jgi:hypothetical protein
MYANPHCFGICVPFWGLVEAHCHGLTISVLHTSLADHFVVLKQIFNGVFMKVNKATINMLRRVEPYVTYGYTRNPQILTLL